MPTTRYDDATEPTTSRTVAPGATWARAARPASSTTSSGPAGALPACTANGPSTAADQPCPTTGKPSGPPTARPSGASTPSSTSTSPTADRTPGTAATAATLSAGSVTRSPYRTSELSSSQYDCSAPRTTAAPE